MKPQVLLMADAEEFRQLAAQLLAIEWPDVEVHEWPPCSRGEIPDFFSLRGYDALLVDHACLRDRQEWLERLFKREDCPPVVLLLDSEDEKLDLKTIRRSAFDCLRKRGLSRAQLVDVVRAAASERATHNLERNGLEPMPSRRAGRLDGAEPEVSVGVRAKESQEIAISGYRMLEKIGSGGMATVYLAERIADGLRLVMKIMNARLTEKNEFLQRFIQEYGIVSKIHCPQVVRIYDQGVTDRHVYIAMEHFSGGDLRARIRKGLEPAEALDILQDVAHALDAVHAQGIVHRDLKPDNVMFRADGSLGIVDFGIATKNFGGMDLTAHGDVLGTPHYLSPEQARGRPVDGRSDLYSLGIVFFEMLTGRRPFKANDAVGLAHLQINQPLPRLPFDLARYQELVDCLTAKRPQDRFAGASALLAYVDANGTTLRSRAEAYALAGEPGEASLADHHFDDVIPVRSRPAKTKRTLPKSGSPSISTETNGIDSVLDAHATLARLGGDAARVGDVARIFTRTVPPLLTLLAEAMNDGNMPFVYEAARSLKGSVAAVEAPQALNAVIELEKHASKRDSNAASAAFLTAHTLVRRLMVELVKMTAA